MTSYTNGDAKWFFKHVSVTPGKSYQFSDYYQSDVPTTLTLEYKTSAGAFSYVDIGALPASTTWKKYTGTFTPPSNVTTVSILHHIDRVGYLNTDNFILLAATGTGTVTSTGSTA